LPVRFLRLPNEPAGYTRFKLPEIDPYHPDVKKFDNSSFNLMQSCVPTFEPRFVLKEGRLKKMGNWSIEEKEECQYR
jgi:hypothetical protein